MASIEAIRRLRVQATSEGTELVAANLNKVADAQQRVSRTGEETARVTESSARRQLSAVGAYDRLLRSMDESYRTQQRFVAGQTTIERAFQQGIIGVEQYERDLQKLADKFGVVSLAAQRQAESMERAAAVQARVNAVTGVTGGGAGASRGADIEAYGRQLDDLRAKYNPLYGAGRQYKDVLSEINMAAKAGAISEKERAAAISSTKSAFVQQVAALRGAAAATSAMTAQTGLARYELINLGRQAQDVGTMLAMGASPMQVVTSQAAQVIDIFASSQGTFSGFMKQATSAVGNFLTVGRLAFGGVALAITGAGLALNSYLDSQQNVQMSLMGTGRASGQTVGSINSIAQSGSSLTGFSVGEARAFAAELASTGKIGKENLEPIVKIGHDIATVFGLDAAEAAKMLGKAYADPVRGAEQLNDRLGFLDAAMQRNIQSLMAQNRLQEAQRVLHAGVVSGVENVSAAVSTSTKFWTALGNIASNAWDKIGEAASRATGIGLKKGLDDQIADAEAKLSATQKARSEAEDRYNSAFGFVGNRNASAATKALTEAEAKQREELERLTEARRRNTQAIEDAQQRQYSFARAQAVSNQLPEASQLRDLRNEQELLVNTMIDVQTSGGAASPILRQMGKSYEELALAVVNATSKVNNFKTNFEQSVQSQATQMRSLTAFSPSARGDVAYESRLNAELARQTPLIQATTLAEGDRAIAIKGASLAISEQVRARQLQAEQAIVSVQTEINMVGKTIGQQAEMRANLQARQAIEQQLLQQHAKWGSAQDAEMARHEEINRKYGDRVQLAARAAANDNISFGRQTALLSQEDVAIAQQLRGLYPDVASALASVDAQAIRTNEALRGISQTVSSSMTSGFADMIDGSKSVGQAFGDMSKSIIRAMQEALVKATIVAPMMRALNAVMGFGGVGEGLGSLGLTYGAPGTAGSNLYGPIAPSGYADGGYTGAGSKHQPAGVVHRGEVVWSQSDVARAGGVGAVEAMRLGRRGYADGGTVIPFPTSAARGAGRQPVTVNVHNAPAGTTATSSVSQDGNGISIDVMLKDAVTGIMREDAFKNGPISKAMTARQAGFNGG